MLVPALSALCAKVLDSYSLDLLDKIPSFAKVLDKVHYTWTGDREGGVVPCYTVIHVTAGTKRHSRILAASWMARALEVNF